MREFLRFPVKVPAGLVVELGVGVCLEAHLINISAGGLTMIVDQPVSKGTRVTLRLPEVWPGYETAGAIAWCKQQGDEFQLGVEFSRANEILKARMIAQFCHIEHYKNQILETEGRELSSDEAAWEWIHRHAADFADACAS